MLHQPQEVAVSVSQLNGVRPRVQPEEGPVAFLNACSAAGVSFQSPTSIPQTLLDCRYRAVVGSLVAINVEPAMAAATTFYKCLGDGDSIAVALVRMRRQLLEKPNHNPVGLAYTCYGDSLLKLEPRPPA
jgi:hypothetical protein